MNRATPEPSARNAARIVFVNRLFFPDHSATSQLLSDLAFSLADQGRVIVVTSRQRYDDPAAALPAKETLNGVEVHRVASTRFGRAGLAGRFIDLASFHAAAWLTLVRLLRPDDLVVAKTDPPLLSVVAHAAARLKGATLINWLQDVYPEIAVALGVRGLNGAFGRWLKGLRNASLKNARSNVVIGERMAAHLGGLGVQADRTRVIANWTDEGAVTPVDRLANPLRRAWNLEGRFVIAYSGNLGRAHEHETMLGAAGLLRDDVSIVFLMIGAGYRMAELRAAARAAALPNIVFRPYQPGEALAASLGVADVHWISLKPALEGLVLPSKVYGVLAAGRPIIAVTAGDGEIARLVEDHGCGFQVDPGDHAGFARIVRQLAKDPEEVARLGAAARLAAMGPFSRGVALAKWREALAEAAAGGAQVY